MRQQAVALRQNYTTLSEKKALSLQQTISADFSYIVIIDHVFVTNLKLWLLTLCRNTINIPALHF